MKVLETDIGGVCVVDALPHRDERGLFYRAFCDNELADLLGGRRIRQINISRTETVGAIRGLHFQRPPHAEMKFVRCLRGRVWDVVVDFRAGSKTFLHWHAGELSANNLRMVVVPEGCAHGFQVLEAGSELLYLHTAPYSAASEGGLRFDDPTLSIAWPLLVTDLSARDRQHPLLEPNFQGLTL